MARPTAPACARPSSILKSTRRCGVCVVAPGAVPLSQRGTQLEALVRTSAHTELAFEVRGLRRPSSGPGLL
eukprot:12201077-Alexandrium_andersonii.AAC.1